MNQGTTTGTQDPTTLFGFDVLDGSGNKIGSVDNVWVDDATNELEFIGVKTGWIFGSTHIIPCADAQISDSAITVPYAEDQIKDAPSFGADDELSPEDEENVYSYYGIDRSTSSSPTGLPGVQSGSAFSSTETTTTGTDTSPVFSDNTASTDYTTGTNYSDRETTADYGTTGDYGTTDDERLRLHEEQLQVGKRQVEAGRVRLRKVVTTERQDVPVELRREDVQIERVPVSDSSSDIADTAFEDREIEVPVMREEPVIDKQTVATGEVRLNKGVQTETRTVGGDVRSEDVEVDDDSALTGNASTTDGYTTTGYNTTRTTDERNADRDF